MSKLTDFRTVDHATPALANRMLFEWLSNDDERADLYDVLHASPDLISFKSLAEVNPVYLLTKKAHIELAFSQRPGHGEEPDDFSNSPFRALGGGSFMLALDRGADHDRQRQFAKDYLSIPDAEMQGLSALAFQAAAVLPLKQRQFDLADLAEQAALRFVGFLFGFAQSDHVLLERAMRKAYRGICFQVMGRHFVSEPATVPEANAGMAELHRRVVELLGLYHQGIGQSDSDERKRLNKERAELRNFNPDDSRLDLPLKRFQPVLRRMAKREKSSGTDYDNAEAATVVVGLISGAVGNIQASICSAMDQFFRLPSADLAQVGEIARLAWMNHRGAASDVSLEDCVWEALRLNPPVAFLPRKTTRDVLLDGVKIPGGSVVLLGIGGATRNGDGRFHMPKPGHPATPLVAGCPHAGRPTLLFGGAGHQRQFMHSCVGQYLSMPLVVHVLRQMLLLPGLAQMLDRRTGRPLGLRRLWGHGSETFPLEFRRDAILTQSPLFVVMKVKMPIAEHAEKLKLVIRHGAPLIEKKLQDAKHVHFASFQFLENDTKLALLTVYDRDFDSYIEHFALQIGALFDRLFEHIQDAPPLPVDEFPKEFVDTIRRYNVQPVGGYFFSAYPNAEVAMIRHHFRKQYP